MSLNHERLRIMASLVVVVAYFACVFLGPRVKLRILVRNVYRAARRIYGIPEFRPYPIADGIKSYSRPPGPATRTPGPILRVPVQLPPSGAPEDWRRSWTRHRLTMGSAR